MVGRQESGPAPSLAVALGIGGCISPGSHRGAGPGGGGPEGVRAEELTLPPAADGQGGPVRAAGALTGGVDKEKRPDD